MSLLLVAAFQVPFWLCALPYAKWYQWNMRGADDIGQVSFGIVTTICCFPVDIPIRKLTEFWETNADNFEAYWTWEQPINKVSAKWSRWMCKTIKL
jgi:hypothetical protein